MNFSIPPGTSAVIARSAEDLRRADDAGHGLTYVSAVAIEEKSVWDYNQGNPSGDIDTLGQLPPPSTPPNRRKKQSPRALLLNSRKGIP